MIKRPRFPRIFFGWWTVVGSGFLSLWTIGYYSYGFSALFKPMASELGFSRAVTSVAASIGRLEGGFEALLTGLITDKYGPRWIIFFGIFLFGLGLILMNFINSLWAFYLVWGVILGTAQNIAVSIPAMKAITEWFVKKRGLAVSTNYVLAGLCGVLVLPLVAWLISTQGWRMTCVVGGLVMWLVGLPIAWFCFKRHRPEYYGLLPDGVTVEEKTIEASQMIDKGAKYAAEVEEVEFTLRQAMRTPTYWLLTMAHATHGMFMAVFLMHSIPFLTDIGIDPVKAAVMLGSISAVSIPFRLIGGFLADRVRKNRVRFLMVGGYFLQVVGISAFLSNQTLAMLYVYLVLYYIGHGLTVPIYVAIGGRYFGRKAFGSIQGSRMMFMTPFSMAAPIYAGWVYDTTGSYITAFTVLAWALAASVVIMALTFPPKPPAQITDIHKIM